ncbi:hypothetical protein [Geodermatophilus sp. SYSU D00700]
MTRRSPRRRRWPVWLAVLALLAVIAAVLPDPAPPALLPVVVTTPPPPPAPVETVPLVEDLDVPDVDLPGNARVCTGSSWARVCL